MVEQILDRLKEYDPEVGEAVYAELARQRRGLELIASENLVSEEVMMAMATPGTNKYAEGYPGHRYYGGCECVDVCESIAIERACRLFGAEAANVQPHSGAQANLAVYSAFLTPGDTVMGMDLNQGGHLTHGSPVNMSGRLYHFIPYGVGHDGRIDYEDFENKVRENKPKLVVAGASAYPRIIDFERMAKAVHEAGAIFMVDMAHIAGLVAAGLHPSPVPYADVVTTTTHKTLRGPRGGLILCKKEYIGAINKAIFPGTQGGPLEHIIAAKAVCFGEALKPSFCEYQKKLLANCRRLAEKLKEEGFTLVSGGTDNHLILVDLRPFRLTGKEFERRLDEVYITVNKNSIPDDPESHFVTSGIRVGTAAVTSRGLGEEEMDVLAKLIKLAATDFEEKKDYIRAEVTKICERYPIYTK